MPVYSRAMRCGVVVGVVLALSAVGCGVSSRQPSRVEPEPGATQTGIASWYGPGFHGRQTSSGEIYDQYAMTAAHQTLPHGMRVRVTNLANQQAVIVRINDRGPFVDDRIVDLSYAAAQQLDMVGPGTVPVRLEVLDRNVPLLAARARAAPPPEPEPEPVFARAAAVSRPVASRYEVQVGTYAAYQRARRTQLALGGAIDRVHLALIDAPDARYYQVRVGPFANVDDASRAARRIVDLGFPALVIAR